jgi:uncharacterized membrane protein
LHDILLVIHILSVIVWLGAGIGSTYIGPKLVDSGGAVALSWLRVSETMGSRVYGPASGLTLLSGIGLVLTTDAYSFGSLFVILGMSVWVLVAIGSGAIGGRQEKRALEAFEAGDEATGRETLRKLNVWVIVEFALLLTTLVAMIYRWGA